MAASTSCFRVAVLLPVVACCWLCSSVALALRVPDYHFTFFLLEPNGVKSRTTVLVPAAPGYPEETAFGRMQAFDTSVLLSPDVANGVKIAGYQGFLLHPGTTENGIFLNAALIFNDASDFPAGTRLMIQGSFEKQTLEDGGDGKVVIVGGTGPLTMATGYGIYRLFQDVATPGEEFFRMNFYVYLPGPNVYLPGAKDEFQALAASD